MAFGQTQSDAATESVEYGQMKPEWTLISDIMAGPAKIREKSTTYLPQFSKEGNDAYRRRLQQAPWRPEFVDIVRSISSKPFGKEVMIKGQPSSDIVGKLDNETGARTGGIVCDIDGRSNGLTVFAQEWFRGGVTKGLHAVLVDFPTMQENATRADEKAAGARPYWVQVPADNIIALYTRMVGGKEEIEHIRIREWIIRRDGAYGEKKVEQIRVMEPGKWELWERNPDTQKLERASDGVILRGGKFNSVPVVLYFTGDRLGDMAVRPPMSDLAHMQIELYQALSRKETIETMAGSPMLAANGMTAPEKGGDIEVGPSTILFAPPVEGGKAYWDFVQPEAANMTELRNSVAALQADMRRIGMQPLTEIAGNPTATGRAIDAAKAHSAVKAWALMLNDAIETAFTFTAEWMGLDDRVQTEVSTDFSVVPYAAEPLKALAAARATGDLSRKTFLESLKRFDALSPDFDFESETKLIAAEPPKPAQETVQIRT